jgi:hypothetical protein
MLPFITSPSTARRVIAAGLAAAAFSATACSDASTAPATPTARPVTASNDLSIGDGPPPQLSTKISVHIIDVTGKTVTEKAMVRFRWSQPKDSVFVMDNSAKDLDPTVGIVKIAAPTAKGYDACVRGMTTHFAADTAGPSYPTCNSKSWLSFDIPLGNVYMRRKPQIEVFMRSGMNANWFLPGGAIHVYDAVSLWNMDVFDGQLGDDPMVNDGKITFNLPKKSFYVFKYLKTPTGKYEYYGNQLDFGGPIGWEEKQHFDLFFVPAVY